jgi:hypothetical protein
VNLHLNFFFLFLKICNYVSLHSNFFVEMFISFFKIYNFVSLHSNFFSKFISFIL